MELSTYFRINAKNTGQFERTLLIADEGAYVSYLEGCTAPMRDEHQLHAAVVELVALDNADDQILDDPELVPRRQGRQRRDLQLRHQARQGDEPLEDHVDPGRNRLRDHLEVSELHFAGRRLGGRVYSGWATTNNRQQADTGTKMIHLGKRSRSTIVSKGFPPATVRTRTGARVKIAKNAQGARNYSQCDSLLIGDRCGAHTFPYLEIKNTSAKVEHEASTSKIGEDQLFYCRQRGISMEDAVNMIVSGFCKEVFRELPMEFAVEAQKLLSISLEGSVG